MANSIRITRKRPAQEGGGEIEMSFLHVPSGNGIQIFVDGVELGDSPITGDVEVRYSLEGAGGAVPVAAQTDEDETSRFNRHIPLSER